MRLRVVYLAGLLLLCVLAAKLEAIAANEEESEYYEDGEVEYEYEYEEEEAGAQTGGSSRGMDAVVSAEAEANIVFKPTRELFYGFHRNVGSGLMKVKRPLVDEVYVNDTALYYDCVRRADAWILALEPNATDFEDEYDIMRQIEMMKKKVDQAVTAANAIADSLAANIPGGKGKSQQQQQPAPEAGDRERESRGGISIKTGFAKDSASNAASASGTTNTPAAAAAAALASASATSFNQENATASATDAKRDNKRMTFREKQELRTKIRREKEAQKEKQRPKFRLGAACETLICGSCKAIVNEFAFAVDRAVNNSEIRYVEQVLNGFCDSKEITLKYTDIVHDICQNVFMDVSQGYKEALIVRFEQEESWEGIATMARIYQQQKDICLGIGACSEDQWRFQTEPEHKTQEQWDERCFTCQAFANDLEERVQLTRHVTERSIVAQVHETCQRLQLEPSYDEICQPMIQGKLQDDIAWLAKVHGESVHRKAKGEQKFSDKLCQEIDWCKEWLDPTKLKEKEAQESMEAVFF